MRLQTAAIDRSSALRSSVFSLANIISIGFRSGLYGGRNNRCAPTARTARRTAFPLWLPRLSTITTSPGLRVGTRNWVTQARKMAPLLARDVRALLLGGVQAFFEGESLGRQKRPHRAVAHLDPALGQLDTNRPQGKIRRRCYPSQQPISLRQQHRTTSRAMRPWGYAAVGFEQLRPPHHAGYTDIKRSGCLSAAMTTPRHGHDTFAEVRRVGSRHQLLASDPASSLNHILAENRIPIRFRQRRSRSRCLVVSPRRNGLP